MQIIPAIDIIDSQCVRLVQGDPGQKTTYSEDPVKTARGFFNEGASLIHVVNLSSAIDNNRCSSTCIETLLRTFSRCIQVGGGIRTLQQIETLLDTGAARVIIGSRAVTEPLFMKQAVEAFGPDRVCLGLDLNRGRIAINGWKHLADTDAARFGRTMRDYGVERFIVTDISRDGTMAGPAVDTYKWFSENIGGTVTASGGIGSLAHVEEVMECSSLGVDSLITGRALYEGAFTYSRAAALADNRRNNAE